MKQKLNKIFEGNKEKILFVVKFSSGTSSFFYARNKSLDMKKSYWTGVTINLQRNHYS